jgi:plastocyanin
MQGSREIGSHTSLSASSIAYTVGVAVDPPGLVPTGGSTGNFVYQPALLHVSAGDTVTWSCNAPFSLSFRGSSPIGQLEVVGSAAGAGYSAGPFTVQAVQGSFHYTIAVWNGSRIFMDADCPRISVN